jgi:hypothetical protein
VGRILAKTVLGLAVAAALLYLGDWAVWRARVAFGGGMGKATVSRLVVAPLKGGKEEYYYDGTSVVACSRSIFPQSGNGACWWLARNPVDFER